MTNAPAKFTQVDLRRAIKAARSVDTSLRVRVLVDGSIVIEEGQPIDVTVEKPVAARPAYRL